MIEIKNQEGKKITLTADNKEELKTLKEYLQKEIKGKME